MGKGIQIVNARPFQSTRPIRGATSSEIVKIPSRGFQSTRPIRGATIVGCDGMSAKEISIHAPHTGRDPSSPTWAPCLAYFNPRAPYGARPPGAFRLCNVRRNFNPRAPYGARRPPFAHKKRRVPISIHAPHTGRDFIRLSSFGVNPISIHAPHTGRDSDIAERLCCPSISIHAPHTGRDLKADVGYLTAELFQSTRPIRGATRANKSMGEVRRYFNPRAPYGARQTDGTIIFRR